MALPASSSSAVLAAHQLSKARGVVQVLTGIDVLVSPQQRLGVVGPNGVGKTTLLRILAGLESSDSGGVSVTPASATVGYLAQEAEESPGETLLGMLARRTGVAAAEAALHDAATRLVGGGGGAEDEYSTALERYLSLGGPDMEARTATVLDELGLPERLLEMPAAALSGGQRARSELATLLLSRYDLLLLDEPTNDLDFDGLERLESWLEQRRGGVVVVSHDRAFLERMITDVLEIDEASHGARLYRGGWAAYLEAKETARQHAHQAFDNYQAESSRLRSRLQEQRQWAVTGVARESRGQHDNDKAQRDFRINRTEKLAGKVKITEKALQRLEIVDKPFEPWQLHLDIASTRRSGDVVARLTDAVVRRGSWQLGPISLEVSWADRLAILGPNGSGKTTLLGALLGRVGLDAGSRWAGPSVVVGELGQERQRFSQGSASLLDCFVEAAPLATSQARSLLAKFGLGASQVLRPAASLSAGERTRAELALLMAQGTNCLVLDEPTNHLDLPAVEQLEQALSTWEGTLLLVTHDRRLLESVELTEHLELLEGQAVAVGT
ncbi:MAG: ABC-F family ATP-binding cassette domain-containing protein [Acidimicrobiales bacterium]